MTPACIELLAAPRVVAPDIRIPALRALARRLLTAPAPTLPPGRTPTPADLLRLPLHHATFTAYLSLLTDPASPLPVPERRRRHLQLLTALQDAAAAFLPALNPIAPTDATTHCAAAFYDAWIAAWTAWIATITQTTP